MQENLAQPLKNNMHIGINQKILKLVAIAAMTADHIGIRFGARLPASFCVTLRLIGRLAFPLYAFLAIEGCQHTHSKSSYLFRLFILTMISEVPFDRVNACGWDHQNVIFTILFGVIACMAFDKWFLHFRKVQYLFLVALCLILPQIFKTDYGFAGACVIFGGYLARKFKVLDNGPLLLAICSALTVFSSTTELFSMPVSLLASLYNGRKGHESVVEKWLYRVWYPLHLTILAIIPI